VYAFCYAAADAQEMTAWKSAFAQAIANIRRKRSAAMTMHAAAGGAGDIRRHAISPP
jgi:hypothetical protein